MEQDVFHHVFESMGISVHVTFAEPQEGFQDDLKRVEDVFRAWDERFSRFKPDSELMRMNRRAGERVVVSPEMFAVLERCVELAKETEGTFDPSVGGHLAAHGYGLPENYSLPSPLPTYTDIVLDAESSSIQCASGQILEPASIVKGLAIDAAGREITHAVGWMLNAGGDILTKGPYRGASWRIGIQSPTTRDAIVGVVELRDGGMATSGTYVVRSQDQGATWNHLLAMPDGKPVDELVSVTVLDRDAASADTHATIASLFGVERGVEYLKRYNVRYLCIGKDRKLYRHPDLILHEPSPLL